MSSGPMAAAAAVSLTAGLPALRLLLRRLGGSSRLDTRQRGVERGEHVVGDVHRGRSRERVAHFHQDVGAAALHHLLVDRVELRADLLRDVALVALDLVLLTAQLLRRLGALLLPRVRTRLQRGVDRLALQRIDGGLDRPALGLERTGESLFAVLKRRQLALQRGPRGLAGVAGGRDPLEVDDGDDCAGDRLRIGRGGREHRSRKRGGNQISLHQNWVPTLKLNNLVSSPSCLSRALAMSIRSGPNGEVQLTPTPIDRRGLPELPRNSSLKPGEECAESSA